jgi:phage protein D
MAQAAAIPIYSQQETFYAPSFQLIVKGRPLGAEVIDDVLQVTYKDNVNEIDSFHIDINNWDADQRTFKFAPPLKTSTQDFNGIFDPGTKIELWMGYQNQSNMRRMMLGEITSLEPNFSESAAPTLSIGGLNEIHQLRTEQHTYSWTTGNKTDTDIAVELGDKPVRSGQPGLGIKVEPNPASNETPDPFVFMNNQYDIVFLLERARRHGYEVYLTIDEDTGERKLFFGLSQSKANAPVYRLEWGRSLINFRPTLSTAKQVSTVTVRGWDRKSNSKIEVNYTLQDLWKDQNKSKEEIARLAQIAKAYGGRTEVVWKPPVRTVAEAKQLARATLEDQSKRQIEATGSTIGLPDLRAGCALEIIGFGIRTDKTGALTGKSSDFDGEYYVTQTTHTISNSGYRTEFSARREGPVQL